ncbi:hypothetical protein EPO15_06700 [bacterium]|nr:MAG: hypothetical protein EPO15_06700 [bacterium]
MDPTDKSVNDPDLEAMRRAFGEEGGKVEIWRKGPEALEYKRLPGRPTKGFDPDSVALAYGGGAYRFIVRKANGQWGGQFEIDYDAAVQPKAVEPATAAAPAPASPHNDLLILFLNQAAEAQRANAAMQLESMKALAAAIGNRPAGPSITEILGIVKEVTGLAGGAGGKPANPLSLMRDTMGIIRELKDEAGGDGEGTPDLKVIGILGRLIERSLERRGEAPAPAPQLAAPKKEEPAPAAAAPAAPAAAPHPFAARYPNLWPQLAPNIKDLEAAIESGIASAVVVDGLLKSVPAGSPMREELEDFAEDPETVGAMVAAHGPLKQHTPWLRELLKVLADGLAKAGQGA